MFSDWIERRGWLLTVLLLFIGALPLADARGAVATLRVSVFNVAMGRPAAGQLATDLADGTNLQGRRLAEILQRVRPDVVVLYEFDYDAAGLALERFHDLFLAVPQTGNSPLSFPYRYAAPSNSGVPSGHDLDNSGQIVSTPGTNSYSNDSFGPGLFPGQNAFVILSRFPIQVAGIRTFRNFRWIDLPGAVIPQGWYSPAELEVFRLSSKNHVDVPIEVVPGQVLHLLASNPIPPSFDGTEDRNGRRNHDEIAFWKEYINNPDWIVDDEGGTGGLASDERFLIMADLNVDPVDGESFQSAANQLLSHPAVNVALIPASAGAVQQAQSQGGNNATQNGDPAFDTADLGDFGASPGNLRLDYILPSRTGLFPMSASVFWPRTTDPGYSLLVASDHRCVSLDVTLVPVMSRAVRQFTFGRDGMDTVIRWQAELGVTYRLLCGTTPDVLMDIAGEISFGTENGLHQAIHTNGASGLHRFYRLECSIEFPSVP